MSASTRTAIACLVVDVLRPPIEQRVAQRRRRSRSRAGGSRRRARPAGDGRRPTATAGPGGSAASAAHRASSRRYSTRSLARDRFSWAATAPGVEPTSVGQRRRCLGRRPRGPTSTLAFSGCQPLERGPHGVGLLLSHEQLVLGLCRRRRIEQPVLVAPPGGAVRQRAATRLRAVTIAYGPTAASSSRRCAARSRANVSCTMSSTRRDPKRRGSRPPDAARQSGPRRPRTPGAATRPPCPWPQPGPRAVARPRQICHVHTSSTTAPRRSTG